MRGDGAVCIRLINILCLCLFPYMLRLHVSNFLQFSLGNSRWEQSSSEVTFDWSWHFLSEGCRSCSSGLVCGVKWGLGSSHLHRTWPYTMSTWGQMSPNRISVRVMEAGEAARQPGGKKSNSKSKWKFVANDSFDIYHHPESQAGCRIEIICWLNKDKGKNWVFYIPRMSLSTKRRPVFSQLFAMEVI